MEPVAWGKRERADARRSLLKALAWRAFAALNTLCTALFFTRKAGASGIMLTETVVKTSMFTPTSAWGTCRGARSSASQLGGKQLRQVLSGPAFPTTPLTSCGWAAYPVDREHDDRRAVYFSRSCVRVVGPNPKRQVRISAVVA